MIDLRALGALDLRRRDGPELHSVLAQPKRTALLAYLALARPHGFHRRDTLIGLFWPEHDTEHARASLRQSLHFLRRSLGEDAIVSRGDEDIELSESELCCDAVQFDAALDAADPKRALALYAGDLMPGFFVEEAPEFERWLEGERNRLRERAVRACWTLAEAGEAAGEMANAAEWGRRALEIAPADDTQIMRLMQLLARSGDRSGALAAFEAHARRLHTDLDIEPTAAARSLADEIRRHEPARPPDTDPNTAALRRARRLPVDAPRAATPLPGDESAAATLTPGTVLVPSIAPQPGQVAGALATSAAAGAAEAGVGATASGRPARRARRALLIAGLGAALLAAAWLTLRTLFPTPRREAAPGPERLAVLYFDDLSPTGSDLALAKVLTETLIEQFNNVPGLKVISAAGVAPFRGRHLRPDSIGRALRVGLLVSGDILREAGRLRVDVELLDARTAQTIDARVIERPVGELTPLVDDVVRDAAVFLRKRIGDAVQVASRPAGVKNDAWDGFQRARQARSDGDLLLETGEQAASIAAYGRADSLFARAEQADPHWVRPTIERSSTEEKIAFALSFAPDGPDTTRRRLAVERGIADANRALERDPGDAAALEARGVLRDLLWVYSARRGPRSAETLAAAEADSRNAVAVDPHLARAWRTLADTRWWRLDYHGALAAASQALEEDAYASDSRSVWLGYESAFQLSLDRRARDWCDELRRRNRSEGIAVECALRLEAWAEPPPDLARAEQLRVEFGGHDAPQNDAEQRPIVDLAYAAVLARAGLVDSAEAVIARATLHPSPVALRWEAEARVLLGQEDAAIRLLRQYLMVFPDQRGHIALDRCYARLRDRAAFRTLVGLR